MSCPAKNAESKSAVSFSSLEKEGVAISSFNKEMASSCNFSIDGLFMSYDCTCFSGYELFQFFSSSDDHLFYTLADCSKSIVQFWYHTGKYFLRVFQFTE